MAPLGRSSAGRPDGIVKSLFSWTNGKRLRRAVSWAFIVGTYDSYLFRYTIMSRAYGIVKSESGSPCPPCTPLLLLDQNVNRSDPCITRGARVEVTCPNCVFTCGAPLAKVSNLAAVFRPAYCVWLK